jgi:hypothetical protein
MKSYISNSAFPQEVYEIIIDHFHDDNATLSVCGLVCRAWVPATRYHLFAEVHLCPNDYSAITRFLELLASSAADRSIASYIRSVYISYILASTQNDSELPWDLLYQVLIVLRDTATHGYNSISFSCMPLHLERFSQVLPIQRITHVRVVSYVSDYRSLMALFLSMPNLQDLTLQVCRNDEGGVLEGTILLPQLHTLEVAYCDFKSVLAPLVTPSLRVARFRSCGDEDTLAMCSFLRPVAPCLTVLRMHSTPSSLMF